MIFTFLSAQWVATVYVGPVSLAAALVFSVARHFFGARFFHDIFGNIAYLLFTSISLIMFATMSWFLLKTKNIQTITK